MNQKPSNIGWQIAGATVGVLVLIGISFNLKDLFRYIKISTM